MMHEQRETRTGNRSLEVVLMLYPSFAVDCRAIVPVIRSDCCEGKLPQKLLALSLLPRIVTTCPLRLQAWRKRSCLLNLDVSVPRNTKQHGT
jgi:hypothetical protein